MLYSTDAKWRAGRIIEEYLFSDNGTFLAQIGPCLTRHPRKLRMPLDERVARREPSLGRVGMLHG